MSSVAPSASFGWGTYLTHFLVEVFLQACDALKGVNVEPHTAAGSEGRRRVK